MINKLFEKLSEFEQVEAIALGGSRSGENFDEILALTEEGLGFTGDGSGMAAHAVVLIEKMD